MKIKSISILGLQGSEEEITLTFNDDLNIVTGRNGAGKTTILKLIWYIVSGNLDLAISEISFLRVRLETDEYSLSLIRQDSNEEFEINFNDFTKNVEISLDKTLTNERIIRRGILQFPIAQRGASVFFPTFRRIEGGFSTQNRRLYRDNLDLQRSLSELSDTLSHNNHVFVSSLSTSDIEILLVKKYSELSEEYNRLQSKNSANIIEKIKQTSSNYEQTLNLVKDEIQETENKKQEIMQPFDTLRELILQFFEHSGIKLGRMSSLSFGNATNAINSDLLSAGEKQMFSFMAYNTFYHDTIFIIDEPELSLHIDWQRTLFPMLLKQGTSNQFIVATHSPFIYSKYPDKELQLISDRGYCESVGE